MKKITTIKRILLSAAIFGLSIVGFLANAFWGTQAAGTISGTVYIDYNMNGARNTSAAAPNYAVDAGAGGVTVNVYDTSGTLRGTAASCAGLNNPTAFCTGNNNGAYSIAATGTGPYRVEFTNLPAGTYPSQTGTNNATTVRIVPNGNSSNVDLGIIQPSDYCQNVPLLVTNAYAVGSGAFTTLVKYPYNYSDELDGRLNSVDPTAWTAPPSRTTALSPTSISTANTLGATFGLAWNNLTDKVYSAAYLKRGARFGSLSSESTGAIYVTDNPTAASPTTSLYVDLNVIFGAGTTGANTHPSASTSDWTDDSTTTSEVGKRALGGMKSSADGTKLYVVNLADRKLYVVPTSGTLNSTTITSYTIPKNNLATANGNCASADVRPFAVGRDRQGQIYVGAVCSAESEANDTKLYAYVWSFSGSAFTLVAGNTLTFTRTAGTTESATWQRWAGTTGVLNRAAPMLTDIEFDGADMILGLRDRYGDQVVLPEYYRGYGDVMRVCPVGGTFTFESNGSCGGVTAGGAGTGAGNGGGEYYADLNGDNREEGALGGLVQVPGFNHVISTFYDPVTYNSAGTRVSNYYTAGIQRYNNKTGAMTGAYDVYLDADSGTFGKAGGIGDSEVLCAKAPLQIGNRVWNDADGDGVQDANETGISGATVRLYQGSTVLGTAVTDTNGEYYFSSATGTNTASAIYGLNIQPATAYQIRLDNAANYSGVLNNLLLTRRDETTQSGFADGSDSDASLVTNPSGSAAGTFAVISLTTGNVGENDHSFDFGFTASATYSLGNRVWYDTNNDGMINSGEVGISGVSVSVLNASTSAVINTVTTDASGYYRFDGLAAGNYVARVNAANFTGATLAGYQNTTGSVAADLDSTSVAGQNGEDGINPTGAANSVRTNGILSNTITLGAPGEPTNEADVAAAGQGAVDAAANMTADFGFYRACLSGTIWNDNGNGVAANKNNARLDAGEIGIASVRVQIYDSVNTEIIVGADGILGTADDGANGMLTNSGGNYNFCGLPPGQFRIVVTPTAGTSSTDIATTANPDNNVDSDDNGVTGTPPFAGKTVSNPVTLTPGSAGTLSNNTVTNASGLTANPTIDFGFVLSPTAITLDKFDAYIEGGQIYLNWLTGDEAGNLGFNIYRETNGSRELLTRSPIAGASLRSTTSLEVTGDGYGWIDDKPQAGAVYWLEDIDLQGNKTMHGPISPSLKFGWQSSKPIFKTLSDLTRVENPSAEREYDGEAANNADEKGERAGQRRFTLMPEGAKIGIKTDGWYRVSADELRQAGFNTESDPNYWQLLLDGREIPIKLNDDNSIEFFGRALDNLLTDTRAYFLVAGNQPGQRIPTISGDVQETKQSATSYPLTVERRDHSFYLSALLNGEATNWFGALILSSNPTLQTLTVRDLDAAQPVRLGVKLQGYTAGEHLVSIRLNDFDLGTVSLTDQANEQFNFDLPATAIVDGENTIRLQSVGAGSDISLTDTVSLSYSRSFRAIDNRLRFVAPAGQNVRLGGFDSSDVRVFEISRGEAVRQIAVEPDANGEFFIAAAAANRELLALTTEDFAAPKAVEKLNSTDWRAPRNEADFVIITPQAFREQAEQLAARRRAQGIQTVVVPVEEIYNEFNYGARSLESIREFLNNAVGFWNVKPRYALLFGDSSYDPRQYAAPSDRDLIPTKLIDTEYMQTASDGWLADFDGDGIEDIALGRIPVGTTAEADAMIAKIARYEAQTPRKSQSDLLVSDNGFGSLADQIQTGLPAGVDSTRLDRAVLTDPEIHSQILEQANQGPSVVTYFGHGSTAVWSGSGLLTAADIETLNNNKLSIYLMMTCLNGYTDGAFTGSMTESALSANGGAIAVWSSSGETRANAQFPVSAAATAMLFDPNGQMRFGDIFRQAKYGTIDSDVRRTWMLFGDPTMRLR